MRPISKSLGFAAALGIVAVAAAWNQGAPKLTVLGKQSAAPIQVIDGKPYVELNTLANELGYAVKARPDGYELSTAVPGAPGGNGTPAGPGAANAAWALNLVRSTTADVYRFRLRGDLDRRQAAPGNRLVLYDITLRSLASSNTALVVDRSAQNQAAVVDQLGRRFTAVAIDAPTDLFNPVRTLMRPNVPVRLTLMFDLPQDAKPVSLDFLPAVFGKDLDPAQTLVVALPN